MCVCACVCVRVQEGAGVQGAPGGGHDDGSDWGMKVGNISRSIESLRRCVCLRACVCWERPALQLTGLTSKQGWLCWDAGAGRSCSG